MTEIIALGILVVAFCWVVWVTHGVRPPTDDIDSRDAAVGIWQQRAKDLKARQDEMAPEQYEAEMNRIRAGVLADSDGQTSQRSQGPALAGLLITLVCVLGATAWGYQNYGGLDDVRYALDDRELREQLDAAEELDQAINIVERAIDRFPAPERWYLLGQLREQTGDLAASYVAYNQARELAELDADYTDVLNEFLAFEAQTLLFSDRARIEQAIELATRSVALQPENTVALGVLGVAAFELSDFVEAEKHWSALLELTPVGSPDREVIAQGLAAVRERLGIANGPQIEVVVQAPDDLQLAPETPVFVYARLGADQPAPLVVGRIAFGDLPTQLVLTDDMKMGPMGGLEGQSAVEVVARVAVGGSVAPQAGDWQGSVPQVDPNAGQLIQLTIDQAL